MAETLSEWAQFLIRWIHLIAGISWIGNSFYFMWLDSSFEPLRAPREGTDGELYMVHGGHFYHVEKQKMRPGHIPKTLHWFMWEATFTWLSGFLLLIVLYYATRGVYLIAPGMPIENPNHAVLVSLALIFGSWFVYDFFWQSKLAEKNKALATAVSLLGAGILSWGLCRVFTGRGAFLHLGAIFATLMVLNVWIRILPGQRAMLETAKAGGVPDYNSGVKAKWRSTHNSYMTLPVLFSMLSNHFPLAYGHGANWVVLILICVLGGVARHMMLQWNKGKTGAIYLLPIGLLIFTLVLMTYPGKLFSENPAARVPDGPPVGFARAKIIIDQRCTSCHSSKPTDDVFISPPNGVVFEDPRTIKRYAKRIFERAWVNKTMPLANKTGMTDEERAELGRWVQAGATIE
jgi:uncharacterized membrane protein